MVEPVDILITGGHGQVGQALAETAWPEGVRLHRPRRADLDLTDAEALARVLTRTGARAVINAAAFTAVDTAEAEAGAAFLANALIPARLADATRAADVPLIHLSTDFVFDGRLGRPYAENDETAPIGVYGASKRAGELAVLAAWRRATVVRTAGVFSARGANVLTRLLARASAADTVAMVADRRSSPTSADDLAAVLVSLTLGRIADPGAAGGIYHCVNQDGASWFDFAEAALAGRSVRVVPISAADLTEVAERPQDSRLSCGRLASEHGLTLRPWRAALVETLSRLPLPETA